MALIHNKFFVFFTFVFCIAFVSLLIGELHLIFAFLSDWVGRCLGNSSFKIHLHSIFGGIFQAFVILQLVLLSAMFIVWWERKVSAHIQGRVGPMYTGGWHGWAQGIADGVKLLLKENVSPDTAYRNLHRFAPVIVFIPAFLCFAVIPYGINLVPVDLNIGILYIFAISGLSVLGIFMAGWSSGSKYSILGAIRSVAQSISYEIPRILSVVPIVMIVGSLKLIDVQEYQSMNLLSIGSFSLLNRWFIFYPVIGQIAFAIFLISSVAETNRVPFDIAEAESELVAGFHVEYSGFKFALFFLSEYAYVLLSSIMIAILFLGGGTGPLFPSWFWLLFKSFGIVFIFLWFRWTFPRLRVDQIMSFNWKFLLPLSLLNILFTALCILYFSW